MPAEIKTLVLNPNSLSVKLLYQPLINVLFLFYWYLGGDMGLSIVALTLLVRLVLFPSYLRTTLNMQKLKELEPEIKRLREELKGDPKKQAEETMRLYRAHQVNPLGGCLPLLIQLPILFALYRIFAFGLNEESLTVLYAWVPRPEAVGHTFLGLVDLTQKNLWLALLAGIFQLWQGYLSLQSNPQNSSSSKMMNWQMLLLFPAMTFFIAWSLPSAVALFWAVSTLIAALQQWYVVILLRRKNNQLLLADDGQGTGQEKAA